MRRTALWLTGRASRAPALVAVAKAPLSFQRSLAPRSVLDQALITGVSLALDYGIAAAMQEVVDLVAARVVRRVAGRGAHTAPTVRAALLRDLAATAAGAAIQRRLARRPDERMARAAARTAGHWLATSGGAATVATLLSAAQRGAPPPVTTAVASGRSGAPAGLRPAVALAGIGAALHIGARLLLRHVEEAADMVEPSFARPPASPLVSGGPGSCVPYATLGRLGRRMVSTALTPDGIAAATGRPAAAAPIRVYVGLGSGHDATARVDLALAELDRTGAFDRALLLVVTPTGTGYVNHVALEAAELLAHGDVASVAIQYARRPSILALQRRVHGSRQLRLLLEGIRHRLAARPPAARPRVVVFGESLGAWVSQDAFAGTGTDGLQDVGVSAALWIGTPYRSAWREQVERGGANVDRALVGSFDNFGQVEALAEHDRARLRYIVLTHDDDAVARWGVDLLVRSPDWLDGHPRSPKIPAGLRWSTPQTFVTTFVDMKNAAVVVPGRFDAKGHDYRADLLPFVAEVCGLKVPPDQADRLERVLRDNERLRKRWLDGDGGPGSDTDA